MTLTTTKSNENCTTYGECFDYLEQTLSSHYLLTEHERQQCMQAVGMLKSVFKRFDGKKENPV